MKIIETITKALHKIGIHIWITKYGENERTRVCKICNKKQIYYSEGATSGMSDFGFWETIK